MTQLARCERHAPEMSCQMERRDCVGTKVEWVPTEGAPAGTDFGSTDAVTLRITRRVERWSP